MKIGYLGAGTWGFALQTLLASKGYQVVIWTIDEGMAKRMNGGGDHPKLPGHHAHANMHYTEDLAEALEGIDLLVEAVTSAGLRPVLEQVKALGVPDCPIVLTSKGIEQNTGLLLADLAVAVLGEEHRKKIGCLSGPSHAEEVVRGLPTTVVSSAYDPLVIAQIQDTFTSDRFRVYPNTDIDGVEFSGALKNVVAIACGISDGLGFGDNTKAALMTRGLHEIRKLGIELGCEVDTINGLAGMGDLCVTCMSNFSRNYMFGRLLAEGHSAEAAKMRIGMVVEGEYSVVSAVQLGKKYNVSLPIAETVYGILYEGLPPQKAVQQLLTRAIKEEHL